MRAEALVAHHQSLFEHELHQLQRGGISTVLTQRFMHLAHGAGALTPQHRQDGYFGVGWKRRGSRLFGKGSGGHVASIIRINSYVNEIIRINGDNHASETPTRASARAFLAAGPVVPAASHAGCYSGMTPPRDDD